MKKRWRKLLCRLKGHDIHLVNVPGHSALWCQRCDKHSGWFEVPSEAQFAESCHGSIVIYGRFDETQGKATVS